METSNKEIGRFAPVFGLPAISTIALQSFNSFYGAFTANPEYIFQSNPMPIFATAEAMRASNTSRGIPVRSGTYLLVPQAHAAQLTPDVLASLEIRQGLLVPKGTASVQVLPAAEATLPNVTYATLDVTVTRAALQCGGRA